MIGWDLILKPVEWLVTFLQSRKDRPRLSITTRYFPEVGYYIIEARNTGTAPITITAAGITCFPSGYHNPDPGKVWPAEEGFPQRLDGIDCKYFSIWLSNNEKVSYAWLRAANGRFYTAPVKVANQVIEPTQDQVIRKPLTPDQKAELYNSALQYEDIKEAKVQLAYIEAQVALYELVAARKAQALKEQRSHEENRQRT